MDPIPKADPVNSCSTSSAPISLNIFHRHGGPNTSHLPQPSPMHLKSYSCTNAQDSVSVSAMFQLDALAYPFQLSKSLKAAYGRDGKHRPLFSNSASASLDLHELGKCSNFWIVFCLFLNTFLWISERRREREKR